MAEHYCKGDPQLWRVCFECVNELFRKQAERHGDKGNQVGLSPILYVTATLEDEEMTQYIYRKTEPGLWTAGFYDPSGKWNPESDHSTPESAASRVHWLNGGDNAAA